MRITLKYVPPPNGTGTVGYRGQDEFSRKWISGYYRTDVIVEKSLYDFLRVCGANAVTVEILPTRDKPYKPTAPECDAF